MTETEFSGLRASTAPDFALGVVRGSRAFDVDSLGRLTGVSHKTIWTPGENTAECKAPKTERWFAQMVKLMNQTQIVDSGIDPGFLADARSYNQQRQLRASRHYIAPSLDFKNLFNDMEIALFGAFNVKEKPDLESFLTLDHAALKRASDEYKEKKRVEEEEKARKEAEAKKLDLMEHCTHGFHAYYEGSNDYGEDDERVNGVIEGYGETVVGTRGFRSMKARIVALHIPKDVPYKYDTLVRRNYPLIPIFDSFRDMMKEFPGESGGASYDPLTDPDFWTRKAE